MLTSKRERPCSLTIGETLKGSWMPSTTRYLQRRRQRELKQRCRHKQQAERDRRIEGGCRVAGGWTHFMRMNSPSGGTNEMVRSLSNLPSFTHWWNVISASSMPVPLHARALDTYDVIANRKKLTSSLPQPGPYHPYRAYRSCRSGILAFQTASTSSELLPPHRCVGWLPVTNR